MFAQFTRASAGQTCADSILTTCRVVCWQKSRWRKFKRFSTSPSEKLQLRSGSVCRRRPRVDVTAHARNMSPRHIRRMRRLTLVFRQQVVPASRGSLGGTVSTGGPSTATRRPTKPGRPRAPPRQSRDGPRVRNISILSLAAHYRPHIASRTPLTSHIPLARRSGTRRAHSPTYASPRRIADRSRHNKLGQFV